MIHPGVTEAVIAGNNFGLDMALSTNGLIMPDDQLSDFLEALTWIRFNISAGTPETYRDVMGVNESAFHKVVSNIRKCVEIKRQHNINVIIGLQMVLIPECLPDILGFAKLGRELGVDYAVIKQCSERADNKPGLSQADYEANKHRLEEAESLSTETYSVIVKWNKITNQGIKKYDHCYGCNFLPQISGNGDLYCCGAYFGKPEYLIGNINNSSFKELVYSARYAEIMRKVETEIDVHKMCGVNCRQNEINEFLWQLKNPPPHVNFV